MELKLDGVWRLKRWDPDAPMDEVFSPAFLPEGWLEAFIERLLPCGLTAIEAYHSEHSEAASRRCLELARHYGLGVSGGSDYHGTNKPRIRLGKGYGSLRVPYSVLEELREMRARRGLPC